MFHTLIDTHSETHLPLQHSQTLDTLEYTQILKCFQPYTDLHPTYTASTLMYDKFTDIQLSTQRYKCLQTCPFQKHGSAPDMETHTEGQTPRH